MEQPRSFFRSLPARLEKAEAIRRAEQALKQELPFDISPRLVVDGEGEMFPVRGCWRFRILYLSPFGGWPDWVGSVEVQGDGSTQFLSGVGGLREAISIAVDRQARVQIEQAVVQRIGRLF